MKTNFLVASLVALVIATGLNVEARTIRANELNTSVWSQIAKGTASDIVVEFHQGDQLPITLTAEGDLLETSKSSTTYIAVKRDFWFRVDQNKILLSFDGITFKEAPELISGSFNIGAGVSQTSEVANAINISFKAFLK